MIGRAALVASGVAWAYEAGAILTRRWPTITNHVRRRRHRREVATSVVVAVHALAAWAHYHFIVED